MKLVADLHTHTVASGHAYSTLQENIIEAKKKGLKMIAITDHGPLMPGGPHLYYFGNMRVLPKEYMGIEILRGVEANILDSEGNLDVPENYLKRLDIVLVGYHSDCFSGGTVEENTQGLINAMKNPFVDVIVHPGNPQFAIDPEKLVEASKDFNVALELNNSSLTTSRRGSLENCRKIAQLAAKKGSLISIGSDAHWAPLVGDFTKALELIKEGKLKSDQILNTDTELIRKYLKRKKKRMPAQIKYPKV